MSKLSYSEAPVQAITNDILKQNNVRLLIKREDENHPYVSGNKWWKLKYNLEEAQRQNHKTLLTFGGAFSNHIYATSAAAAELGINSIGIIRGEEIYPLNNTLSFAKAKGMHLHFVSREDYRRKTDDLFIQDLKNKFGDFYLIPEGGTNDLAIKGTRELGQKLLAIDFDYLMLPVGTGGTLAGIINAFDGQREIGGVSVLKNGEFLKEEINDHLTHDYLNWRLLTDYHHGRYAKTNDKLNAFIEVMRNEFNLPLDHVYTGKMLWALMEEVKQARFKPGSTVLALHTGGLQGATQTSR